MSLFIGIDVSKNTLDIATYPHKHHLRVANCTEGFQQLLHWLQAQGTVTQVALEASGRYGEAVACFLVEHDYAVSYLNPKQIHAFAQVHLHYQKTDRQDAQLIAHYCQVFQPDLYQPANDLRQRLQQRSRRLHALQKMRQQEVNRSKSGIQDDFTLQQIKALIQHFDVLIQQTQEAIHHLIMGHEQLAQQYHLLTSVKGIAEASASLILAEIDITHFDSARQLAAYIGITPRHFQSGTSVNKRASISKQGNARLRAGLYMPAVVAKRWNPPCKRLADRLKQRHKHNMVIIIAVMRKLVHQIYGVLKSGQPFDPHYDLSA